MLSPFPLLLQAAFPAPNPVSDQAQEIPDEIFFPRNVLITTRNYQNKCAKYFYKYSEGNIVILMEINVSSR